MDSTIPARLATAFVCLVAFSPAYGESIVPLTAQQQKLVKECNAKAAQQNLQFQQRKQFVDKCVNGEAIGPGFTQRTAQQRKLVKDCNAEATRQGLQFERRKQFLSKCLNGEDGVLHTSQLRMNYCNQRASTLKLTADARQSFMTNCLKG